MASSSPSAASGGCRRSLLIDEPTAFRPPDVAAPAPLQLTPGTILGERYRIVSLIGRGGMGQVYRADDLKLGQSVALKFLAHHGDSASLYEEVRIGRQVSHPNVCRLYDIAEVDGRLFITMEFVDGEDLASLLRRIGRLPSEKALMLTRDICAGLAAAHDKGVIHRDLKPANVMIDGRGRARVTDFGLALAAGSASDSAGTPAYMAPEQLEGTPASVKSDIYALGLVLYEIFTGRRTFDATSTSELIARQRRSDFTRPTSVTRDVPAVVERVIVRCLDAQPANRPSSVEEIMRELPGFDPLAAAIAAGETPSPAMVAAASERGDLSRVAAWALLALFITSLFVFTSLTARTTVYRRLAVLKSPEVLLERVNEILATTRQPLTRRDASGFFFPGPDDSFQFHWRQSPQPMSASSELEPRVRDDDPPLTVSGMATVITDATGHLVEFAVVPPRVEAPPAGRVPVDWNEFFRLTGLTGTRRPAPSYWAAPVDSDEKRAWVVGNDGTRIEAAAYHGKPVWFAVIRPSESSSRAKLLMKFTALSAAVAILLTIIYITTAVVLANRNLRDRKSTRLNSSHTVISYAVFCLKNKKNHQETDRDHLLQRSAERTEQALIRRYNHHTGPDNAKSRSGSAEREQTDASNTPPIQQA